MQTRVKIFCLSSGNAVCALLRPDGTFRQVFMLWRDMR